MIDQATELRRLMEAHRGETPRLHVSIAVVSGKGGVGKTNLSVNLGITLAQLGSPTTLVDADWGLANAALLLGSMSLKDMENLHRDREVVEGTAREIFPGLRLLPSASSVAGFASLPAQERRRLLQRIDGAIPADDLALYDSAPGISESVMDLVDRMDLILLVTTPEPTSFADAYRFAKNAFLQRRDTPIALVVNQADDERQAVEVARGVSNVMERYVGRSIPFAGYLRKDNSVTDAVRRQKPFMLLHPHSPASLDLQTLAHRVRGECLQLSAAIPRPLASFV